MNENHAYAFDLDSRPPWKRLPVGPLTLRGWFVPKGPQAVRDLRAVVNGRAYPGRHGLPNPVVAGRWPHLPQAAYAGLEFPVEFGPGDSELRLEFLNHDYTWVEYWRREVAVTFLTLAGPLRPRLNGAYLPALLARQLQELSGAKAFESPFSLDELIRQACSESDESVPGAPWHAALDRPGPAGLAHYHGVQVCGWAFHETLRIKRLYGTAGITDFHPVKHGLPQPGVERIFAQFPHAKNAMLFGIFPFPPRQPNPGRVKVYAELEDGTHHLLLSRRFWATPLTDAERPLPDGRRRTVLPALESLYHRIEAAGFDPGGWWNFLSAARKARIQLKDWFSTKEAPFAWEALAAHERQRRRQDSVTRRRKITAGGEGPADTSALSIGLVTSVDPFQAAALAGLINSLTGQTFRSWQLVIVPRDPAARSVARKLAVGDARIVVADPGEVAAAAEMLTTDYLALVDPGAVLAADALAAVADAATGPNPPVLIYTDEETTDPSGVVTPWPWPDWSPVLTWSGALSEGLGCLHRAALVQAGGLRACAGAAVALDALLRITAGVGPERVRHLATYALRRPVRPWGLAKLEATLAVVNFSLLARGLNAEAVPPDFPVAPGHCWVQLRWSADYLASQPVTIVIPTRDRLDLLQRCLQRLEQTVDWRHVRLVVVDDGSREPKAVRFLEHLAGRADLPVRVLHAGDPPQPFNYSRLVNLGTAAATTPLVLHLNNDVDALEAGWLEDMVGWFALADTGAVGAKLVYADGRINHAGIMIDATEALPFTPLEGVAEDTFEYPQLHRLARDVSAVIGACLLTRTDLYRQLGGFNEQEFGVAYNDVDFCLRLRAAGWRVLYSPRVRLLHWGSESRGRSFHESEHLAFLQRYGDYRDPCFSPQLRLAGRTVAPDLERPRVSTDSAPLRLLVATHNLGLEGAPLFLYEFVEHAIRVDRFSVDLVAFADGPLRAAYEKLGVAITLVDRHPVHAAASPVEYATRVAEVRQKLDLSRTDLVVANTVVGFWITELARQAGRPSLWFIHESVRVPRFFEHELRPGMQSVVHDAFRGATRVVFLCAATRRYYDEFNGRDHFRILPGWVDAAGIRAFRAAHDRGALRRRHGIGDDETVVLNVGTLCERKGQYYFLAAARRLAELHRGPLRFLLVGGLLDMYHELFEGEVAAAGVPGLQIVDKTDAVYDYYGLADLAVCTSFEESFPRVLLEAMMFEVPIVSTSVHGVPEIITDRAEGFLVRPGEVEPLARTMLDALAQGGTPNSLAPMALSKVLRRFDRRRLLPRHVALAREAAGG